MLRNTFVHARGVGPGTETRLWRAGARTWDAFLELHAKGRLGGGRLDRLPPLVRQSDAALRARDIGFFDERLPRSERWRLYPDFSGRAAFFDCETTGLSHFSDEITVIGLYDGERFSTFVRGRNLDDFPRAASRYALLVSFNGAQFDVPFLQAEFRGFRPAAHLDLRFPLARLGFNGGLKAIERAVGIRRPSAVRELDGFDAVRLWHDYRRGRRASLDLLIEYLREDVQNLAPLATLVVDRMRRRLGFGGAG